MRISKRLCPSAGGDFSAGSPARLRQVQTAPWHRAPPRFAPRAPASFGIGAAAATSPPGAPDDGVTVVPAHEATLSAIDPPSASTSCPRWFESRMNRGTTAVDAGATLTYHSLLMS